MNYLEEDMDTTKGRIIEIEKNIAVLQENISALSEHLKETQKFLMKLAHNQAEVTKRISSWPYIAVAKED